MANGSLTSMVTLDLRNPVVHAAVASLLDQGQITVTSDPAQAALRITDSAVDDPARSVLVLGNDVPWPVHPRHLLRKIEMMLNHRPRRLGRWSFDPQAQTLCDETKTVVILTTKEAAILTTLLDAEEPVSRDELLSAVWGYEEGLDTHTLETHIYRLRRKLDDEGAKLLLTDAGGYALSANES